MDESQTPPGDALGAAGAAPTVEWNGKTYTLGHPTQRAKDRYCESLVDAEAAALKALADRRLITPAKYDERLESLGARIDRLEHRTGGPLWLEYAAGSKVQTGLELFVWSLFREHHDDVTPADVRAMFAGCPALVKLAVRRVLPGFFDDLAAATGVPRSEIDQATAPVMEQLEALLGRLGG